MLMEIINTIIDLFKHPNFHIGLWLGIGLGIMITISLVRSFLYVKKTGIDGMKDMSMMDDINKLGTGSISDESDTLEERSENK